MFRIKIKFLNQIRCLLHKPTDELLMGVSAVEEHGQLGLLRQVKLLLKVSATHQKEQIEAQETKVHEGHLS